MMCLAMLSDSVIIRPDLMIAYIRAYTSFLHFLLSVW
jgi:hypothetical protein